MEMIKYVTIELSSNSKLNKDLSMRGISVNSVIGVTQSGRFIKVFYKHED